MEMSNKHRGKLSYRQLTGNLKEQGINVALETAYDGEQFAA